MFGSCVLLVSLLGSLTAGETILGAYVFQRHGDRTPKALAPTNLTTLGYTEVTQAGSFFRDRYIESAAKSRIAGINSDVVKLSQLQVTAPADNVLANSAQAFTQALYPALGGQASAQTLRNGSTVQAPLNGYQLIPVGTVSAGSGSEDSGWLQDVSDCGNAETSSNNYFFSPEYQDLYAGTQDFYTSLAPVVNSTFNASSISYKNAYTSMSTSILPSALPNPQVLTHPNHSLRLHQRRHNPQRNHPLLNPPHPTHPRPPPRLRSHPRARTRLQRHLPHQRNRRHDTRLPSPRLPQQHRQHHCA